MLTLGIMIWRQAPLAGFRAVGILIGIKLFLAGLMMLTFGGALQPGLE